MSRRAVGIRRMGGLRVPAQGGLLLPYTISGLVYWLDPERYADPTAPWTLNGSKVASAPSRESSAGVIDATKTAAQSTDANRPTLNTSDAVYGGRATLSFPSTTIFLDTGAWSPAPSGPFTVYVVGEHSTSVASNEYFLDAQTNVTPRLLVLKTTGTGYMRSGDGTTVQQGNTVNGGAPAVQCHVVAASSGSSMYVNGPSTAETSGVSASAAIPNLRVGAAYTGTLGVVGKIATILIYQGSHDAATRTRIMQWLEDRYALNRSLTPYLVGGLAYWLDPDRYADPSGPGAWTMNSTKVATAVSRHSWAGVADTSKNVTQATDGSRPTINVADGAFNGKNTLSFSAAASQYLQSGAWTTSLSQPLTTYAVFVDTGDTSVNRYVYDGIATGNKHALFAASITGNATITAGTSLVGASVSDSAGKVTCAVYNGASSAVYINNSSSASASGNAGTNTLTGITLGTLFSAVGQFAQGKLMVLIVYSGAHTAAQRALIMQWLGARYGIAVT